MNLLVGGEAWCHWMKGSRNKNKGSREQEQLLVLGNQMVERQDWAT